MAPDFYPQFIVGLFFVVQCRDADLLGDYCRGLKPVECCTGRDDSCAVPILRTLCYCDIFCDRVTDGDCCPDFHDVCAGPTVGPNGQKECIYKGQRYTVGEVTKENCNYCKCVLLNDGEVTISCDTEPCLIRPSLIEQITRGDFGWKASNYSFLWSKTLEEGTEHKLGTFPPTRSTMNMTEIHIRPSVVLPRKFDSRSRWSSWLQPIKDQGDCGASWAFSSTALASDRLAVMSGGQWQVDLSPQLLISCQSRRQDGCAGGHLDRAWWFLRKHGTSSEQCYPYESGESVTSGKCKVKRRRRASGSKIPKVQCVDGTEDIIYLSTPPYRTAPKEAAIMHEIYNNGPVQATFRVKEDFYSYRTGVYRHTKLSDSLAPPFRKEGWHSVRIMGWGESYQGHTLVKYWICANSWGSDWGEDGYFRILRGVNECDIESFVVGVWANLEEFDDKETIDVGIRRPRRFF